MSTEISIDHPRILEEAERVVIRQGHPAVNMRELARRVGVTATALYHYFDSREEILRQVRLRAAERLNRRIRAIDPAPDPMDVLHRLGREYLAFAEEQPNLYRLLFEFPVGGQPLGEGERPVLYFTYDVARSALERLAAAGHPIVEPRYQAMMGWIMLHGFASLMMSGALQPAEGMDREQLKELFLQFYSGGGNRRHD
jgi:AcrR family transcriptional regulator